MSQTIQTNGFILRSVNYRESDRIFTLFTLDAGKISVLARGVRKSQSRYGGAFIPFANIEMVLTSTKSHLWQVKEATLLVANTALGTHLSKIGSASYLLEITRESVPDHEPDAPIFHHISTTLDALCHIEAEYVSQLTIAAALKLLRLCGLGIGLNQCNSCHRPVPVGRPVFFHPGRGGVICTPCGGGPTRLESETISALKHLNDTPMKTILSIQLPNHILSLCESAVSDFIEHHLGRPLKTRAFLG